MVLGTDQTPDIINNFGIDMTKTFICIFIFDVIPPIVASLSTVYFVIKSNQVSSDIRESLGISPMRLLIYPIGLSVLWTPSVLYLGIVYLGGVYMFWFDLFRLVMSHSAGFLHAVVYGLQSRRLFRNEQIRKSHINNDSGLELSAESIEDQDNDNKPEMMYVM